MQVPEQCWGQGQSIHAVQGCICHGRHQSSRSSSEGGQKDARAQSSPLALATISLQEGVILDTGGVAYRECGRGTGGTVEHHIIALTQVLSEPATALFGGFNL